jgi:hypothetical protein
MVKAKQKTDSDAFELLIKYVKDEETKVKICEKFEFPLPFDSKYNTYNWDYFARNYTRMEWRKAAQYLKSIFAKLVDNNNLILQKSKEEIVMVNQKKKMELFHDMHINIPVEAESKKKKSFKSVLRYYFFREYCFDSLKLYQKASATSSDPEVFERFRIHEPVTYMKDEIVEFLDFMKRRYKYEEDFIFDFERDSWRFRNHYQKTQRSVGHFGARGGEGKTFMGQFRCKIYEDYSNPGLKLSRFDKEQTKKLVQDILYSFLEEIPKENIVNAIGTENFKILWGDSMVTRSMGEDEKIMILMDIDLATNHKDFCGLLKDEAMSRRVYPIELIRIDDEANWTKYWDLLKNTDFIRSYVKYM